MANGHRYISGFLFNIYTKIKYEDERFKARKKFNEVTENLNISDVSDSKIFTMNDIKNLRKNLYGIVPLGEHRKMFNEMFDEWIKNPNCKPEYG